jgi:mannose-1-phosphate guanylyltransferase/mannose-6-phosphate isomerase
MLPKITPLILSGGVGTRLWPLSRALRPKQLLPLASDKSMLQETVLRTAGAGFGPPLIICNEDHRFMIAEQLRELGVTPKAIVLEPQGRNTAPAVAAGALYLEEKAGARDGLILVMPSDHVIRDVAGFRRMIETAADAAASGALVTFGIKPTHAETGYGYVRRGPARADLPGCFQMAAFVEKPDAATAAAYAAGNEYFWNSGMFLFATATFLAELERLKPDVLSACRQAVASSVADLDFVRLDRDAFATAENISIDYAVMEGTDRGVIVPVDIGWSDVGSWSALWAISDQDTDGNVILGDVLTLDTRRSYIRADSRLVAAVGIEDLVVVSTDDVILVARMDRDQDVKRLVDALKTAGRTEAQVPRQVFRPWGWFKNLHEGNRFQVKEIVVNPGEKLSAQMHHHRAEHWIVVSGTAKVTRDDDSFYIVENQSIYIPHTTRHALENPGKIPLKMIEVQSGPYLGEDDIVRFQDRYGRATQETVET